MTYKQIEASREVRLWIGQVVVPAVMAGVMLMANPITRDFIVDKTTVVKDKFKTMFKK